MRSKRGAAPVLAAMLVTGCGPVGGPSPVQDSSPLVPSVDAGPSSDGGDMVQQPDATWAPLAEPELWYMVNDQLIRILFNANAGVVSVTSSRVAGLFNAFTALTMLKDGSLLGGRWRTSGTVLFHIPSPPRDGSPAASYAMLGTIPLMIEALYADCEGRVYLMDSGSDGFTSDGNRLLRFTGSFLTGDLSYVPITDLSVSSVADIDDLSPGIRVDTDSPLQTIRDNPGFAIDTGELYAFDYVAGVGTHVGQGGSYGIHALSGAYFNDQKARLYILSGSAQLFEVNPTTFVVSLPLLTGPTVPGAWTGLNGFSGLAGPLSDCSTGFED